VPSLLASNVQDAPVRIQVPAGLQFVTLWIPSILYLLLAAPPVVLGAETGWRVLGEGLEIQVVKPKGEKSNPPLLVTLLRVWPRYYDLKVIHATDFGQQASTVRPLAEASGALGAINAGFFYPDLRPMGLVIARGKPRSPLKKRSHPLFEGVFLMKDGKPYIGRPDDVDLKGTQEAIQSGPLLVMGGLLAPGIDSTSQARHARSAIGIDRNGNILLVTSSGGGDAFTLAELARFLLPTGHDSWGCEEALNLDGGGSTQLYLQSKRGTVDVRGLSQIPVALGIFRRPDPEISR